MKKPAKDKLLEAAFALIRSKGYTGTTVDALCEHAGVTKGTFFHYFDSKEDLAIAATAHWMQLTGGMFAAAGYHQLKDPRERLLAYVALRRELIRGTIPEFSCLAGTMVQEAYASNDQIRAACRESIFGHAQTLEGDINAAKKLYAPHATWTANSLALHMQAVIQGSFILAKASNDPEQATSSITHLDQYIRLLLPDSKSNQST